MDASESHGMGVKPVQKFFISYRRSAEEDSSLAGFLETGLTKHGHKVFIDVDMTVGTDWAKEIGEQIESCDHLVVLLSEDSIHSEMVQGEVRMAHHAKRDDGRPTILPVRVNYDGPLDYELSSYLSRLHYSRWNGDGDSYHVLTDLLRATTGLQKQSESIDEQELPTSDHRRPQPVSDPRTVLLAPGGAIGINDPFYVRRPADDILEKAAEELGATIMIQAPRQTGRSSLLIRYLAKCREAGKRIVYLDFHSLPNSDLDNYQTLLQFLAKNFLRDLRLHELDVSLIGSQQDFIYFIEDHILINSGDPLTICLDDVDRLVGRPYQSDFFSMLRHWHNIRPIHPGVWGDVDIALVIATDPSRLIESSDQSPFNVAVPVELGPFEEEAVSEINVRYGSPLEPKHTKMLFGLLAGHPYLTRLTFFRLLGQDQTFEEIIRDAERTDGPYGDHLRAMLLSLQQEPSLLVALKELIRGTEPDRDTFHRLYCLGLARRTGSIIEPANLLYARFFKQVQ